MAFHVLKTPWNPLCTLCTIQYIYVFRKFFIIYKESRSELFTPWSFLAF